jgi:hypothetical protein
MDGWMDWLGQGGRECLRDGSAAVSSIFSIEGPRRLCRLSFSFFFLFSFSAFFASFLPSIPFFTSARVTTIYLPFEKENPGSHGHTHLSPLISGDDSRSRFDLIFGFDLTR